MKRLFVLSLLLLAAATSCCGGKKEIGVQLYSVRQIMNAKNYDQTHESVLAALGKMGYTAVEAANYSDGKFYGVTPEQFRSDVEAAGMKVLSSHTNHGLSREEYESKDLTAALQWWKDAIPFHKAAGMKYIVMPSGMPKNIEDLPLFCEYLNEIGKLCAAEGILFGYHNHSGEFKKEGDVVFYDYMLENTDPQYVFFQMDVYWAVVGDASPVNYFKRYPGRFTLLHIKDWKEVGQSGMVGFDAIFGAFPIGGTKDYIVEMEASSYDDILRTCQESADYLKNAPFVK